MIYIYVKFIYILTYLYINSVHQSLKILCITTQNKHLHVYITNMYRTYMLKTTHTYERDQRINKLRTYQSENWKTEHSK